MSFKKISVIGGIFLVALVVILALPEQNKRNKTQEQIIHPLVEASLDEESPIAQTEERDSPKQFFTPISSDADLPKEENLLSALFQPFPPNLPIVETVSYGSRVPWLKGRQAYLGDYASHFSTSKHFIARSLHGEGNYLSETVRPGDRFNILRKDKHIEFHLVVDLSRLKMWLYAYDGDEDIRYLLKTYPIAVGKLASHLASGCLTPLGVFSIGKDTAIYKEGVMGTWRNEPKEMISIFGVRWVGFGKEIADCTGSCKGLGLHGVPWTKEEGGKWIENRDCIGKYVSSGCIRLLSEDIEEVFAIITSRKAFAHIVQDFSLAKLPGKPR